LIIGLLTYSTETNSMNSISSSSINRSGGNWFTELNASYYLIRSEIL